MDYVIEVKRCYWRRSGAVVTGLAKAVRAADLTFERPDVLAVTVREELTQQVVHSRRLPAYELRRRAEGGGR